MLGQAETSWSQASTIVRSRAIRASASRHSGSAESSVEANSRCPKRPPAGGSVCGSPVPMLHPDGGAYWVPAGLLDSDPGVPIAGHIFVGSKAPWDEIAGDAPRCSEGFGSPKVE